MKTKNGGQPVLEKKLFHGTDPKHVKTICEANFDWRVCGVNGTVYGQGELYLCYIFIYFDIFSVVCVVLHKLLIFHLVYILLFFWGGGDTSL